MKNEQKKQTTRQFSANQIAKIWEHVYGENLKEQYEGFWEMITTGKPVPSHTPVRDIKAIYPAVLEKVKSGLTVQQACKSVGITTGTSWLYRNITAEQKKVLRVQKAVNRKSNYELLNN